MRPRLALLPVVALAALAGGFGAGAARATPSAPGAAPTICVALVVDARALGSDVSTSCAKVAKGATGTDVLQAAGHTIGYRNDGLICTIDGLPKNGCAGVDDSHYWAYFHRAPGATRWTYSTEGAATYQPVNASTEGWVFDDGTANTPENVPYNQICTPTATASPTPTHTATHHPHPVSTPGTQRATPASAASSAATPDSSPSATPNVAHHAAHHPHTPATNSPTPRQTPSPILSATSAALAGAVPPGHSGHGAAGLVIGLIVVLMLGALAVVRFRRSPR